MGGTGMTEVTLLLFEDWRDVQREDFADLTTKPNGDHYSMLKVSGLIVI
jgi:hypothetical protein